MALKFYKCNVCGKIVVEVESTDVTPICCGEPMTLLMPETSDGVLEKHVPVYDLKGTVICVNVGAKEHPMTDEHHIDFIVLETNTGFHVRYTFLDEGGENFPGACFHLNVGEKPVSIVAYCNIHGLYLKDVCKDSCN